MREPVFVLVHGAWVGGWNWRYVTQRLWAQDHVAFAPSLTGLGDRAHLMSPEIDLSTHIADILGIIESHELEDVVLVGHSYGGMVISGVAAQAAERIRALVYLDAFVPEDGQCALDLLSPERRTQFETMAAEDGDGWRIPPIPAEVWGIEGPARAAWFDRHSVAQPLAAMREPVSLTGRESEVEKRIYVLAGGYDPSPFTKFAEQVENDPAWTLRRIDSRHFVNVSHPEDVAAILTVTAAGI